MLQLPDKTKTMSECCSPMTTFYEFYAERGSKFCDALGDEDAVKAFEEETLMPFMQGKLQEQQTFAKDFCLKGCASSMEAGDALRHHNMQMCHHIANPTPVDLEKMKELKAQFEKAEKEQKEAGEEKLKEKAGLSSFIDE